MNLEFYASLPTKMNIYDVWCEDHYSVRHLVNRVRIELQYHRDAIIRVACFNFVEAFGLWHSLTTEERQRVIYRWPSSWNSFGGW